jgi:N-acetylmuramoyl-L-alanine amidase-like
LKSYLIKLLFLLFIISLIIHAQVYTKQDIKICVEKFQLVIDKKLTYKPIGNIMVAIGNSFIGSLYKAHTLEVAQPETLVVNLRDFDCTTYVESCLALARAAKMKHPTVKKFMEQLQYERYRSGKIDGYPSRLHYFTDWIYDGQKKGIVKDITSSLGGIPYKKEIDFMTTHRDAYKQLKNDKYFNEMKNVESELNKRKLFYIPKDSVAKIQDKLKDGDIIATTTNIPGLDVSHVAMIIKLDNEETRILEAPDVGLRVKLSYVPLSEYLMNNKKQTGIIVARPLEPK